MEIHFMKPFFVMPMGNVMKLVFASQYLSILKDGEILEFVPVEGKEILFNLETGKIENPNEIFIFTKGPKFVRASLHHLMWACKGFSDNVREIAEMFKKKLDDDSPKLTEKELLLQELVKMNIRREIDKALEKRDFETARKLADLCR